MKSVFWLVSMLAISSLIESSYSNSSVDSESVLAQSERCCHRNIVTIIDPMPPGQENDLTNSLVSSCEGPLLKPYKCPLTIDFFDAQMYRFNDILIQKWIKAAGGQADLETERAGKQLLSGIDYWIIGKLIADNVTEKTKRYKDKDSGNFEGGDLSGNFTFKMQLYDPHHRQVVKEAQVS